ncbi:MAG: hypothetical protein LBS65_09015 [Desulfovibrio sp.]|jgi:hypothetical protein|nr:hypothetical protein [Desulfovibrio sp.]
MPGSVLQGDFTSGELAPSLSARVDLAKYGKGCRTMKNFLVQAHGGAVKRPGFELLDALPGEAALVPFVFNQDQTYCLIFGNGWLRVATHAGVILDGDNPYQIDSPYTLEQARQLSYVQSADVLFIACHGVRPQKLKRLAHDHWEFEGMVFTAPLNPPVWNDYAGAEEAAFELAYGANSVYYKTGSWFNTHYYLIGEALYRKLDSYWQEQNHQLAYSAGNAYIQTEDADGQYYNPINENLYRVTGAAANIVFVNGAKNSDGSVSAAQLVTPYTYYVTAVNTDGQESGLSAGAYITGPASNNWQAGDYITLSWLGIEGVTEYRVYKSTFGGRAGYVAATGNTSWQDHNAAPSVSEGAPQYFDIFPEDDFPGAICLFEQRLVFASSPNRPQTIWMSKSGDYRNFATYEPQTADSPIELTIAGQESATANWMVPLRSLIMGMGGMEWEIAGRGETAFSASSAKATPQSYWGSSLKRAMVIGNVILHVSSSGSQVRSLQYEFAADSYGGTDLSIMAAHLLENNRIADWTYQKSPDSVVWAVRDDGVLLGLTFQSEHQIAAWHRHDTQGLFKAVCAIPHGNEHSLFAVVERGGVQYLERMAPRYLGGDPSRAVFLDCALTYEGEPSRTISGLDHLEGKKVGVFADGAVLAPRVVEDGQVTLDSPASLVSVGLLYTADLETMPVEMVGQNGSSVALKKTINVADIIFRDSLGVKVGMNRSGAPGSLDNVDWQAVKWRTNEPYGKPPAPFSGMKSVTLPSLAENIATVCIRSDLPTPVTVLALVSRIKVNDG